MEIPKINIFDPVTLEYLSTREVQVVDNVPLTKNAFGTITPIGEPIIGHAQVWKSINDESWIYLNQKTTIASIGDDGSWYYIEDHRKTKTSDGTPYWLSTDTYLDSPKYLETLGKLPTGVLLEQPQKPIAIYKEEKLNEINVGCQHALYKLTSEYPDKEFDSFSKQEEEAKLYYNDNTAEVPYIKLIAETRGISISELVLKILSKVEAYNAASAKIIGLKQKYKDQYELLNEDCTLTDINSIIVDYTTI